MSVQSEISRISGNVAAAYNAIQAKGGTVPSSANSANLAQAIASIQQQGGDDNLLIIEGTYNSSTDTVSNLSKTFDEIVAAIGDGAFCVLKLTEGTNIYYLPIEKHTESNNGNVNGAYFVDTELLKKRVYIHKMPPLVGGPPVDTTVADVTDFVREREPDHFLFGGIFNAANNTVTSFANFDEIDDALLEEKVVMMYLNDSVTDELFYLTYVGIDSTVNGYIFAEDVRLNKKVTIYDDDGTTVATVADIVKSWNDLTNKPFYEETIPAINLEIPQGASYAEGNFALDIQGTTVNIPVKMYRVGNVYTPEQLVGAEAEIFYGEPVSETETGHITADDFIAVERNSETIGYLATAGETPCVAIIVEEDNTVFDDGISIGQEAGVFTSDSLSAGIYLTELDLSNLSSPIVACTSITKAASTVAHTLDSKFVPDSTFWVNGTITQENGSVACTADKTFAEISAAITAQREVRMRVTIFGQLFELPLQLLNPYHYVIFSAIIEVGAQYDPPVGDQGITTISIKIDSSDNVTSLTSNYNSLSAATGVSF